MSISNLTFFKSLFQWETIVVVGILLILLTVFDLRPAPMLDGSTSAHPPEIFSRWYVPKFTEYLILYGGQILAILHIVYRIRNAYHTGSTVVLQVKKKSWNHYFSHKKILGKMQFDVKTVYLLCQIALFLLIIIFRL